MFGQIVAGLKRFEIDQVLVFRNRQTNHFLRQIDGVARGAGRGISGLANLRRGLIELGLGAI